MAETKLMLPAALPAQGLLMSFLLIALATCTPWVKSLSLVWLSATPWTVAHQAPPYMGFSRQEYWSGLPFPSPGDLPDPGIEPRSPSLQADALPYAYIFYSCIFSIDYELNPVLCWWTGKLGGLQSMGSQRVRHDWVTELTLQMNIYHCAFV